tara:strand:+ start:104 stop:1006 length:903 start_codon:yes stop_codon:yes gene_type:complete
MPDFAIILCTFNPHKSFFKAQIESISKQNVKKFVYVFDDCSSHNSITFIKETLTKYLKSEYKIIIREKNLGFAKNFISSITKIHGYKFYAFCDQDDIWHSNRLDAAAKRLSKYDLYCSASRLIDMNGNLLGVNRINQLPSFNHSLVQSIAGGNTYVFKENVIDVMKKQIDNIEIISHDWYMYQILSGCGFKIYYDSKPTIDYRIHKSNLVGREKTFWQNFVKLIAAFKGKLKYYNDCNIKALSYYEPYFTSQNKKTFYHFVNDRNSSFFRRISLFTTHKLRRDSFLQNVVLLICCMIKKI